MNTYLQRFLTLTFLLSAFLLTPGSSVAQNQTIGGDLTGEPLLEYLRENYTPNQTLGYSTARDRMYTILDNRDGMVIGVYTYFAMPVDPNSSSPRQDAYDGGNGINAEHLWPQSLGAGSEPARSDLHHLRSTEVRANQDRGNLKFGTIPDNEVDRWYNKSSREDTGLIYTTSAPPLNERDNWSKIKLNDRFESKLDTKGDIARSIFYFYTIYRTEADAEGAGFFESMEGALLEWHDIDKVDNDELTRTQQISNWQGNVNPFILDTTLVRRAYYMDDGGSNPEFTDLFTETFGSVSTTTDISSHTFDNSSFTFEGNSDIRDTQPSTGYENASGDAQVFMNIGQREFIIGNINTAEFEQLTLSFGVYTTGENPLTIEYRTDSNTDWSTLSYDVAVSSGSWTYVDIVGSDLPSAETLSLRFTKDDLKIYRIDDISMSGVPIQTTSSEEYEGLPERVTLHQNYPNPFNPSTSIQYSLKSGEQVKLSVFDMLGREVAVIVDGTKSAGNHTATWDASNVSSGIYFYSLQTESTRITRKMTLMK